MAAEEEPLYSQLDGSDEELEDSVPSDHPLPILAWKRYFFMLLGIFSTSLVVIVILAMTHSPHYTCPMDKSDVILPYSPADRQFGYVNRFLTSDPDTPKFMGRPRPEMDDAWHELLEGTLIRVTEQELDMAGNSTSVEYSEGGYVAGLGLSHTLHCLKRLKQYMYPDYYYSQKEQNWEELESHADHCLESLRQIILCHPDTSVYTLEWTRHSRAKPTVRVPQPHACANWPELHDWMKGRAGLTENMVPPPDSLYADKVPA